MNWLDFLALAAPIVLGLLGVWAGVRFGEQKHFNPFVLGLLMIIVAEPISLYFVMKQLSTDEENLIRATVPPLKNEVWKSVVKEIADYDSKEPSNSFSQVIEDPLRRKIERSLAQATDGAIKIDNLGEVERITANLMKQAGKSVHATSFVNPDQWWKSNVGGNYASQIKEVKKHVPDVQRVFLFGSTEEASKLADTLRNLSEMGDEVHYACATEISAPLRKDYIIIDNTVAAEMELDENRRFLSATFYTTQQKSEEHESEYQTLLAYTTLYTRQLKIVCPTLPRQKEDLTPSAASYQ